jgi:DNA helicase-2/ATP-dependent DNA helicase PcrA
MDLSILNEKQKEAVTTPLGPVLVLAGAGSGKTRVLTYRIAYLIEQGLMAPEHILAITFTNKAAKEMQTRMQQLLHPKIRNSKFEIRALLPMMGTFHSVSAKLLRREIPKLGYNSSFVIFDADDQLKVIREIIDELAIGKKFSPSLFRAYISSAKNVLQTPAEFNVGLEGELHRLTQQIYTRYQNFLFSQNAVDFDDLLMLTVKLFQASPQTLQKYQELFKYVLVDEYQDTNHAQYMLLKLLVEQSRNLFVVGDDAQSIYGFRGSNIANILSFEKDYPESVVVKLEQNYRSTKHILHVADSVIKLNSEQKPKVLWTDNADGAKIRLHEAEDERDEAVYVAKKIVAAATGTSDSEVEYETDHEQEEPETFSILDQFLKKQRRFGGYTGQHAPQLPKAHGPLSEFAVLYRTHAQSRALEEVFIEAGIPYQIIGGVKFYERKEIKDMLAYLRLVMNFRDLISLKRVINEPARGIGDKSYQTIKQFVVDFVEANKEAGLGDLRDAVKSIKLPPKQFAATQNFFLLLEGFARLDSAETLLSLMRLVFKKSGLEEWLDDGTEQGKVRIDNVRELFTVATKWDGKPWEESLPEFLEEVALITEIDTLENAKDAVTMMTLHSAKGLEFDTVFFVGLEEGILPHSRSLLNPSELSEEVRLAYVGVTRARKDLYLLYARGRTVFGNFQYNAPSRILKALPPQAMTGNLSALVGDDDVHYEAAEF